MKKICLIFFYFIILTSCNKNETLLLSEVHFDSLMEEKYTFQINSDSTYHFISRKVIFDYSIDKDSLKGVVSLINDTIYLKADSLNENFQFNKAIIRNGFIELIHHSNCCVQKYKVIQSQFKQKQTIDFTDYPNYAVFPYLSIKKNETSYDLTQTDLQTVNELLKNETKSNSKLRNYNDYLIQLNSYKNQKNEIIVTSHLMCKNITREECFRYQQISMKDGGNCNVYVTINLSENKIIKINIAGEA